MIPHISNEELKEFDQMYDNLSLVDSSYLLMWRPLPLPWSIYMRRIVRLLNGDTDVSVEEDAVQLTTDGGLLLSAEKEYSEGDDIHIMLNTLLPHYGLYSIDMMYLLSNYIIRCCICLNNQIPTRNDKNYSKSLSICFNTFLFSSSIKTKQPGVIAICVNALASKRLSELKVSGDLNWITRDLTRVECIKALTCNQRQILYFNLFTYMYQDSLYIPVVHYMNKTLKLVAALYIMEETTNWLPNIKPYYRIIWPVSRTVLSLTSHVPLLINSTISSRLSLPSVLYKNTNYQTESKYKGTSQGHTVSHNVVKSLSNREFVKIIAGIISFVSFTEYNVSGKALSLDNLSISQAELDKLASRSLTDDYFFQLD